MAIEQKYKPGIINMLIAIAVSLIINFSYFVFLIMTSQNQEIGRGMPPSHSMPNMQLFLTLQLVYFFVLMFVLLSIMTVKTRLNQESRYHYVKQLIMCVIVVLIFYFIAPISQKGGNLNILLKGHRLFNPMLILKSSFAFIVAALYGRIFELIYQQQHIVIENQMLKNENLENRYNMLVGQINPHFFFNSLNSLSMLVRQEHKDQAIKYIDQLSDTFRYILQNGHIAMATLGEELKFLDAYRYLHEIRYADKLFFEIDVDEHVKGYRLPTLSIQPLIENAVKHNTITSAKPFVISIKTEDGFLVVSNPLIPKIEPADGTGIGLKNMSSRYVLLTGRDIVIERSDTHFVVKLPLITVV